MGRLNEITLFLNHGYWLCTHIIKVIVHKSCVEVFLVEQDTIDYVTTAYFEPKKSIVFIKYMLCNFLVQTLPL